MRSVILLTIIAALAAGAAFADFGDIVRSWEAPWREGGGGTSCHGLAWDGEYIWCNCDYGNKRPRIYRCLPSNGSVVSWFDSPFIVDRFGRGMHCRRWQGQPCLEIAVWDAYTDTEYIYRLNYKGEIIGSFVVDLPGTGSDYVSSVVFDGSYYWVTDPGGEDSIVYKLNNNGAVLASFAINGMGDAHGICKQTDFIWVNLDDTYAGNFYGACKARPNGSIAASFTGSNFGQYMYDCTFDGKYLWLVASHKMVYCCDVSNAPAVVPASVGRIKALYR